MTIDAHFHIWELGKFPEYQFPTPEFPKMMRNYTIEEFETELKPTPVEGAVFVQVANDCLAEIRWLCGLAETHPIIKGVVGGLPVSKGPAALAAEIAALRAESEKLVGCRYILNYEDADTYLTTSATQEGLRVLEEAELPFDLVLYPRLIKQAIDVARKFPRLRLMVDHVAKPLIRDGYPKGWAEDLKNLASFPNVYCKVSGLVTEAALEEAWTVADLAPYVANAVDWFGSSRCVYGSDWPVALLNASTYGQVYQAMWEALPSYLDDQQRQAIFHRNAVDFYRLKL